MATQTSICTFAMIPVRANPSEGAEMVTQILFGEAYHVLGIEGRWASIRTVDDDYPGWIDAKLVTEVADSEFAQWTGGSKHVTCTPFSNIEAMEEGNIFPKLVPMGSVIANAKSVPTLMGGEDHICLMNGHKFVLHEDGAEADGRPQSPVECAKRLLGAPYLWGGRTAFGIDCSGLVQLAFKVCGVQLPRDASQMVGLGSDVAFGQQRENDVAFFVNDKGRTCHVGLCMADGRIVHASGSVRIDTLDAQGIYNAERTTHTHKLSCIKRLWDK